jgi:CYTH domain-containing protein
LSSAADIDPAAAAALGFLNLNYVAVERERRWLCRPAPPELVYETWAINDLYVAGTGLRLREARPLDGGPPRLRFTRKADLDARTRLITTIYLGETEFAMLAAALEGLRLSKLRHRLRLADGTRLSVDEFQGDLAGLRLAEKEFESEAALATFQPPAFALREVTDDARYTGAQLAAHGLPQDRA